MEANQSHTVPESIETIKNRLTVFKKQVGMAEFYQEMHVWVKLFAGKTVRETQYSMSCLLKFQICLPLLYKIAREKLFIQGMCF